MAESKKDLFDFILGLGNETLPESSRKNKKRTRGLPDDKSRRMLAETYLKVQHRLWPDLVKAGILPEITEANIGEMAEQFRQVFLSGKWSLFTHNLAKPSWVALAAAYIRFSHDNSNPRSLDQQLELTLKKARELNFFVPWQFVFADFAVTGMTAARHGYQLVKNLMQHGPKEVDCLVFDDQGRATRNSIEALHLGNMISSCKKRMVGASDGFDSSSDYSKIMLHIFAMLHEMFIIQLSAKVRRGMGDAFSLGKNIYAPAVGYKLVDKRDKDGTLIVDVEGFVEKIRITDEVEAKWVCDAYHWYADLSWSLIRIVRMFNDNKVGGSINWSCAGVKQMLRRSTYRGVEYYEMTKQVCDPDSGAIKTTNKPKSDWKVREVPEARIVPDDLWERTQVRLDKSDEIFARKRKGKTPSRTELFPKTLFRPICGDCKNPMSLGRSGKYAAYFCNHGRMGSDNCSFRSYKAAGIIDRAILDRISREYFTEEFIVKVVELANERLQSTPKSEAIDGISLDRAIRQREQKIRQLNALLDCTEDTSNLQSIFKKVAELEEKNAAEKALLAEAIKPKQVVPNAITTKEVSTLLDDLRALLNDDVGAAAPVLSALTGPVVVTHEPKEEGGKPEWKAHFMLNAVPVFLFLARKRNCPTAGAWDLLNVGDWTIGEKVELWLPSRKQSKK